VKIPHALLAACLASSAAFAESNDILKTLDEAQRLWESSHPTNYSYTMYWSYAFTRGTYKVSVRGDQCTAKVKRVLMREWASVDCESERLRVTDLFAHLREQAQSCPADVQLDLDKKYGFISSVSFFPKTDISDEFWSAGISNFRRH
jgi:hypothetical protein